MQVTVVDRKGPDTARAVVTVRRTRDDARAYCRDYLNTTSESCISKELQVGLASQIKADCMKGVFTTLTGGTRIYRKDSDELIVADTKEVLDDTMASGREIDLAQFKALCPFSIR